MDGARKEQSAMERLIREGSDDDVRRFFVLLRPPEMADMLETVPDDERLRVLRLMKAPMASDVLIGMRTGDREETFVDLSPKERAEIVHEAMSDDAADLIGGLDEQEQRETLRELDKEDRAEIEELLEYHEETAGGIMQTEVVTARGRDTVAEAIERVKQVDTEEVGEIHEVFVVDAEDRLIGTVSPADLLHADPAEPLRAIIEPNPESVPVDMDQEKIARYARDHDLAAIPVIDPEGRLLGQILHDDIADVIAEEATEDIAKMAGADPEEVYDDSVGRAVRSRTTWLFPTFVGGLMVAFLMGRLGVPVMLAAFVVVVVGMAGGVGAQNAALTVRSLALGRIDAGRVWGVIGRRVVTGMLLGLIFGILLFGFAVVRGEGTKVALVVGIAIFWTMTCGAVMGVVVPLLLDRFGADPAIAASPFIQTANDLVGVGILIWVARLLGLG